MDKNALSHTSWRCKYHIVFAPKYRRQEIYIQLRKDIGSILRELCSRKGINNNRSRVMSGSYPYAGRNTTKVLNITNSGIFKRKKFADNIR